MKEKDEDEEEDAKPGRGGDDRDPGREEKRDGEAGRGEHGSAEARLREKAKVSEKDARRLALSKVPDGTIREAGLEMENGKLQWSFDIATPGAKDITEVSVNAVNGEIISIQKESAGDQEKEQENEQKGKE